MGFSGRSGVRREIWGTEGDLVCRGRFGVQTQDSGFRSRSGTALRCRGVGGDLGVQKEIWGTHLGEQVPLPFQSPGSATWQVWP